MHLPLSTHHKHFLLIRWYQLLFVVLVVVCFATPTLAQKTQTTTIYLSVYNSYSGNQSLLSTGVTSGNITYINTGTVSLAISAEETSSYTVSGDTTTLTGNGTGGYTNEHTITLATGDGNKSLQTIFMQGTEPNITSPLFLFVDTTSPTSPLMNTVETLNNGHIFADWQSSIDTGVAGVTYTFILSDDPSFTNQIEFTTQDTSLLLEPIHIPYQNTTLYRHISAQDSLGNTVYGSVGFFGYTHGDGYSDNNSDSYSDGYSQLGGDIDSTSSDSSTSQATQDPDSSHRLPDLMAPLIHGTVPKYSSKIEHESAADDEGSTSIRVMLLNSPYPLDMINVFVLPENLQRTGAGSDPLPHLLLLIKYLPDTIDKQGLYYLIDTIIHIRYLGVMLLFWILCYDIELYKQRLYKHS